MYQGCHTYFPTALSIKKEYRRVIRASSFIFGLTHIVPNNNAIAAEYGQRHQSKQRLAGNIEGS
jgi:hypothetical protein